MTPSVIGSQNEPNDDANMGDVKLMTEVDVEQVTASKEINPQPNHQNKTLTTVTTITTLTDDTTTKSSNRSSYPTKLKFPNLLSTIYRYCKLLDKLRLIITHRWWWWELSSILVSIFTMMTVLVILFKVNNKALSEWVFPIQPNSMVSVFMTISKSALLMPIAECISQAKWMEFYQKKRKLSSIQEYDEASRGPWGAAILLFSRKFVGWIAWLGALLTVISLALDPFTQQILDFPSRNVALATGIAEVASTQFVDTIDLLAMRGAIINSIYVRQGLESPLTYKCSTSSCLWNNTITSLGVCSVCHDITASFTPVCTTSPGPLKPGTEKHETWTFDTTTCVYTFDKNITLTVYIQSLTLPASSGRPTEFASQYTQIEIISHHPLTLSKLVDSKVRWLSTSLIYTTLFNKDLPQMPNMTIQHLAPQLHICGLYFCAQSYDHSLAVINGTLTNTQPTISLPLGNVLDKDSNLPIFTSIGTTGRMAEVLAIRPSSPLINFFSNLSSSTTTPAPAAQTGTLPGHNPPSQFIVSQQALFSLEHRLNDQLLNTSRSLGNVDFGDAIFPRPDHGLEELSSSASVDLSDTFERIAQAITGRLRIEKGSTVVDGEALVNETYFSVRWGWLGLPLGVLVLAGVLLVGTILRSSGRERGEGIWKGNSLAMLVHPLVVGGGERGGLLDVNDLEGLEREADMVEVMLDGVPGGDGGRLGFVGKL